MAERTEAQKAAHAAYNRKYRAEHPAEKTKAQKAANAAAGRKYRATHPGAAAAANRKHQAAHPRAAAARMKVWRDTHPGVAAAAGRKYRDEHPGAAAAAGRKYYAAHPEECAARAQVYRETHPEECAAYGKAYGKAYYAEHPEERAAYGKAYYATEEGRAVVLAVHHRRRARKLGAVGADYTTTEMIKARCDLWGNRCYICGAPMTAIDHVKPLAKGGAHLPCNLRPICKSCNSSKRDKWPYAPAMIRYGAAGRSPIEG